MGTTFEAMSHIDAIRQRVATSHGIDAEAVRNAIMRGRGLITELRELGDDDVISNNSQLESEYLGCIEATQALRPLLTGYLTEHESDDCRDGIQGLLDGLCDRIKELRQARDGQTRFQDRFDRLTNELVEAHAGRLGSSHLISEMAQQIIDEASDSASIQLSACPRISPASSNEAGEQWRARFVSIHALNTAQIAARAFAESPEQHALVVAALVADIGMLDLPWELLAQPTALTSSQRLAVENHPTISANILCTIHGFSIRIIEAVRHHHESPDGGGYPTGAVASPPLAQQLAACSVYTALISPRPYRDAKDKTMALTTMLLAVEHGGLERNALELIKRYALDS